MKTIFDYIFYRLAKVYYKTDGPKSFGPFVILSLIQVFLIINLILLIEFNGVLDFITKKSDISKIFYLIIFFLFMFLNFKRYKHKFNLLDQKWKSQARKHKIINDLLILIAVLFLILFSGFLINLRS